MAKLLPSGQISGAVGPIVYVKLNGQTIIRTKPGKGRVKQSAATKSSASQFGKASAISKNMRNAIQPITQGFTDSRMYSRFTAVVLKALRSIEDQRGNPDLFNGNLEAFSNFQFRANDPFDKYCAVIPEISFTAQRRISIRTSNFSMERLVKIPSAILVEWCFLVTVVDPINGREVRSEMHKIALPLSETSVPACGWESEVVPENTPVIVSTALFYFKDDGLIGKLNINGKDFHPAKIIAVMTPE